MSAQFFGKYRGVVTDNFDPLQTGRIMARVPDLSGSDVINWAMPCAAGNVSKKIGSALPKIGASVWIEFEQGDPSYPIWTGCFYGNARETPPSLKNN